MIRAKAPVWRADLDALEFLPGGHGAPCMVHRLAFRKFCGPAPDAADCLSFFDANRAVFQAAAAAKIEMRGLKADTSLHLNSRDIDRQLTATL